METNKLYLADNLDILTKWYSEGQREFIDLIYIDPPFGNDFDKKWNLKWNSIQDYINQMYPRVFLMREMLKPTGSFYYHCDPTASHYIKMMLDQIFGMENFRNEIVWCYTGPSAAKRFFPEKHDVILFYSKSDKYTFNVDDIRIPYKGTLAPQGPNRKWNENEEERIKKAMELGKVVEDYWSDISIAVRSSKENLGYPTQKPEKLMERIELASSNPGDLVVDFYMGGGTTIAVAEKLKRNWIGVDINPRAIEITEQRLKKIDPILTFEEREKVK